MAYRRIRHIDASTSNGEDVLLEIMPTRERNAPNGGSEIRHVTVVSLEQDYFMFFHISNFCLPTLHRSMFPN